ncbi:phosphatase [Stenotrophomonas sp. LMG 10879]|nr:phosphatase [Stenotrophomonas sp. LMG 10879]
MAVTFECGDIFATPGVVALAHGCNCAGAMGKGVAVSFKGRFPAMYEEYRRRCKAGEFTLGDVFYWESSGQAVFNLGTQKSWKTPAELWAIDKSLREMIKMAESKDISEIALPRVGAGLGGLNWSSVREVLQSLGSSTAIHLRVCEEYVEGRALSL